MNLGVCTKHFTDSIGEHVWKMNEFMNYTTNVKFIDLLISRYRTPCIVCLYLSLCF